MEKKSSEQVPVCFYNVCMLKKNENGYRQSVRVKEKIHLKIENTQGVWILYSIGLTMNFLIAEKQMTAAKRPKIERGTVKNKPA